MKITYYGNSGFALRTDKRLLIFDYPGEGMNPPVKEDNAIAFVSHAHADHFWYPIIRWKQDERVVLVTSHDAPAGNIVMHPGDRAEVEEVQIEAFGSTDEGVSYLVSVDGMKIFHAGDFNLWHWKNEADEDFIRVANEQFEEVLDTLRGRQIDLAFFPVDPRMGEGHEEGAMRFIEAMKPKLFIPMHFWGQPEAAEAMKEKELPEGVSVIVMTREGETITI